MKNLQIKSDPRVEEKFTDYSDKVRKKITTLRKLIVESATEVEELTEIEETLKWGEPSYLAKKGSTIRIDWKAKSPDQYAIYFKCTSKLVETFRLVYGDTFNYEKNRAIVFQMNDKIPKQELKSCIKAALTYHKVKQLPMLDMA